LLPWFTNMNWCLNYLANPMIALFNMQSAQLASWPLAQSGKLIALPYFSERTSNADLQLRLQGLRTQL
jgi:hypothetical protein